MGSIYCTLSPLLWVVYTREDGPSSSSFAHCDPHQLKSCLPTAGVESRHVLKKSSLIPPILITNGHSYWIINCKCINNTVSNKDICLFPDTPDTSCYPVAILSQLQTLWITQKVEKTSLHWTLLTKVRLKSHSDLGITIILNGNKSAWL